MSNNIPGNPAGTENKKIPIYSGKGAREAAGVRDHRTCRGLADAGRSGDGTPDRCDRSGYAGGAGGKPIGLHADRREPVVNIANYMSVGGSLYFFFQPVMLYVGNFTKISKEIIEETFQENVYVNRSKFAFYSNSNYCCITNG